MFLIKIISKFIYLMHLYYIILLNTVYCNAFLHICHGVDEPLLDTVKSRMATKTAYKYALRDDSFWNSFNTEVDGCIPLQIWFLTRHGIRYPLSEETNNFYKILPDIINQIIENHMHGRGCLDKEDIDELSDWVFSYEPRDKGQLHETGSEELYELGLYWKQLYPQIFNETYNSDLFKVQFTVRNRTSQSAYHFLRGMFGDDAVGRIKLPDAYIPDYLLRFYESCPFWLNSVYKNNKTTYYERNLFEKSEDFESVVRAISARLGYMHPISVKELLTIYDECRYETAWFPDKTSIWCKPFGHKDFEILEYHQDLKYYYEDSYGTPLNLELPCKLIKNIQDYFGKTVSSHEAKPRGILYFAHDKTIMKFLSRLALFQPHEHLKHNNYHSSLNKKFRAGLLSPFASNVAFVLYRCNEYKVVMFHQGQPYPLKRFCKNIACSWNELIPLFQEVKRNCDLHQICKLHDEL